MISNVNRKNKIDFNICAADNKNITWHKIGHIGESSIKFQSE